MTDRDVPNRFNPERPNQLPPELATFLGQYRYAALLHATNLGTVLLVKAPGHEIASVRGRVPIATRHELHSHPASPVIRMVTRIYDLPDRPLALETFINVGDPDQRTDYEALSRQDELLMLFYNEQLQHALSKRTRSLDRQGISEVLSNADRLLAAIPEGWRDFDLAKAEVMNQTDL